MSRYSCCLYRLYDKTGTLLYVGITANFTRRWSAHSQKTWAQRIRKVELEYFASRDRAAAAELEIIKAENPALNSAGKKSNPTDLGKFLTAERCKRGLSRTRAAEKIGCSVSEMSLYEVGGQLPRWSRMIDFLHLYECDPNRLLRLAARAEKVRTSKKRSMAAK